MCCFYLFLEQNSDYGLMMSLTENFSGLSQSKQPLVLPYQNFLCSLVVLVFYLRVALLSIWILIIFSTFATYEERLSLLA